MTKELRKTLRGMKNFETKTVGNYNIMKMHNKYSFSFSNDYYDECDYIATVGERQAIEWILEDCGK